MANKREENGRHFGGDSRRRLCPSSQVSLKLSQSSELSFIHGELKAMINDRTVWSLILLLTFSLFSVLHNQTREILKQAMLLLSMFYLLEQLKPLQPLRSEVSSLLSSLPLLTNPYPFSSVPFD